jgi:hypothetical protein
MCAACTTLGFWDRSLHPFKHKTIEDIIYCHQSRDNDKATREKRETVTTALAASTTLCNLKFPKGIQLWEIVGDYWRFLYEDNG